MLIIATIYIRLYDIFNIFSGQCHLFVLKFTPFFVSAGRRMRKPVR